MKTQLILLLLVLLSPMALLAADLIAQVPATAPEYGQLRLLYTRGMLPDARRDIFATATPKPLTRYDYAFLLIEPLERCIALSMANNGGKLTPEQRRRGELALAVISPLSTNERNELLDATSALLATFQSDIAQLAPDLPGRATPALDKLRQFRFNWLDKTEEIAGTLWKNIHFSIDPKAEPNSLASPLQFSPMHLDHTTSLFMLSSAAPSGGTSVAVRPVTLLEAAVDLAFGRFNVYGAVKNAPGQDPALLLTPDANGKAMVGCRFDLGTVKDLGICGIFEYHVMRTGTAANPDVNAGAVGGIGLKW